MFLSIGERAPNFTARASKNPAMRLDHLSGRVIALTFIMGSGKPLSHMLAGILRQPNNPFDDKDAMHFFVVLGESGEVKSGIQPHIPGHRVYFDKSGEIATLYGVGPETAKPITFILSPRQQILEIIHSSAPEIHGKEILAATSQFNSATLVQIYGGSPVVQIPFVIESDLAKDLVDFARARLSGLNAIPRLPLDHRDKQDLRRLIRLETSISDDELNEQVTRRVMKRIVPELERAFHFKTRHLEGNELWLMRAHEGARVDPMRFSEVKDKERAAFVALISLNSEQYMGGGVRFPEYSKEYTNVSAGSALLFSSALLHEVSPLKEGEAVFLAAYLCEK